MESLKVALFAAAQGVWTALRAAGRAVLGRERFDRLVGLTGLRGLKSRTWLTRRRMPDGTVLLVRPHDQCIVDEVYERGAYSGAEILPGQTVVDAGAHIGAFTLMAARRVGPTGRVVCFEPSPRTRELLDRNLAANAVPWVSRRDCALAGAEGRAELFVADDAADNPAADTLHASAGRAAVPVRVRRLDDVLEEEGVGPVDHLKIDVEGAELSVMDGAPETLARTRRVVLEVHPPRVDPAEVRRRLEALGFSCRLVSEAPGSAILEASRPS